MRDDAEEARVQSMVDTDLGAYAELRRRLSGEISPAEAERARILATGSIRMYSLGLATTAVLGGLMPLVDSSFQSLSSLMRALLPIAICLLLVSRWRVNFAGRTLLPIAALLMPSHLDRNTSLEIFTVGAASMDDVLFFSDVDLGVRIGAGYVLGWMFDLTANQDVKRPRFAGTLTAIFSLLAILVVLMSPRLGIVETMGQLQRSLLVIAWIWWLHPLVRSTDRYSRSDVATVFFASLARWRRRATGRFLAAISVSIVLVATLNGFALSSAVSIEGADPPVTAKVRFETASEPVTTAFFWTRMGRLLRQSDFAVPDRHVYVTTSMPPKDSADLDFMWTFGTLEPVSESSFKNHRRALESFEIKSASGFQQSLDKSVDKLWSEQRIWLIERKAATGWQLPAATQAPPASTVSGSYIREALHKRMKPVSIQYFARFQEMRPIAILGSGIFATFAFVMLWRRGGDSSAARWVGVWFAGIAMSFALPLAEFVLESTFTQVAESASEPERFLAARGFLRMLHGTAIVGGVLAIYGVAAWLAYLHLRPAVEPYESKSGRWLGHFTGRKAAICIAWASICVSYLIVTKSTSGSLLIATVASAIATVAGIVVLEFARRRSGRTGIAADPRLQLGRGGVALFVIGQIPLIGSVAFRDVSVPTWSPPVTYLSMALLVIYGIAVALYVLRTDWLRVSAGRDLSWLMTVILLPFAFELLNGALPTLLEPTGLFLPGAANYASLFLIVGLMQPLQRFLETALEFIASPGLRRIQRDVDDILEKSLASSEHDDVGEQILAMFKRRGVDRFALWIRQHGCRYIPEFEPRGSGAEPLELSPMFCARLLKIRSVIDTEVVHSEWEYFFDQFEIDRMANRTQARYVYPLRLGNSLWGLMFIADSPPAQKLAKDSFKKIAGQLGFAIARRRR